MSLEKTLIQAIIERTQRVPRVGIFLGKEEVNADSEKVSRQLDIALISVGFKAVSDLLEYISGLTKVDAVQLSKETVNAVKTLVGDHVEHNTYFKNFPDEVPDTIEFWTKLIEETYGEDSVGLWNGNLLELNGYGKYQHTYEEMVRAHQPLVEKSKRALKRVELGAPFQTEVNKLFISLAESAVPLNENDKALLAKLASVSVKKPVNVPVRENKAIINSVYLDEGEPLVVDTVADVLRLAAFISDGDVTLTNKTRYKSFTHKQKRGMVKALSCIEDNKLADVLRYKEEFKRLNERLHGGKYPQIKRMLDVARGVEKIETAQSKVEKAFESGNVLKALDVLDNFPGQLVRSINRLLLSSKIKDLDSVYASIERALEKSSTRVAISLRQYIENRNNDKRGRVFVNKKGGTYVLQGTLEKLPDNVLTHLKEIVDNVISDRMADTQIVVAPEISHYAIPISDRDRAAGLNVVPRGTETWLDPELEVLRFFVYWKEKEHRTDYDLSAIMLDENFQVVGHLSYTGLTAVGGVHSGDITSAPRGASEFIDIELNKVQAKYVVPQVNIFTGDSFDEAKEAFFGYMLRSYEEKGKPFEAKTVETKSDLYGSNRVALPMIFINTAEGWKVKQLNVFLKGNPNFNAIENNSSQTQTLVEGIVNDKYLTLEYLAEKVVLKEPVKNEKDELVEFPVKEITHVNLHEVIPEQNAKK